MGHEAGGEPMVEAMGGPGGWPRFPQALLRALREAAPEGGLLQFGLWHGESLTVRRVLAETDEGVLAELEPPASAAERGPSVVAVPWYAIARVETLPPPARRARPGFVPGG